jgi:K+-sensing histidine kinase KdpD
MRLPRLLRRYGLALLIVSLALNIAYRLSSHFENSSLFVPLAAILFVTWYQGRGPGFVAVVLAAAGIGYFLLPPVHSFSIDDLSDLMRLGFFVVLSLVVVMVSNIRDA